MSYGFGYTGAGYEGGYWRGGNFFYNRTVNNISAVLVTSVYNKTVVVNNTTNVSYFEPEVHRIAGELALKLAEPDRARAQYHFQNALAVARVQRAKSWELRAAISIARLLRSQRQVNEAHYLLAPVYDWFTEGFDTLDLKDAKALLE